MRRRKRIVGLVSIFIIIFFIIFICSTMFKLQSATVEFSSKRLENSNIEGISEEQIINSANFKYGENLLFTSMTGYIDNIEKSFGYVKVVNIERKFPSSVTIHIAERESFFRMIVGETIYVFDENLKVLNKGVEADLSLEELNLPVLTSDLTIPETGFQVGEFAKNAELRIILTELSCGLYTGGSGNLTAQNLHSINITSSENAFKVSVYLKTGVGTRGCEFLINGKNIIERKLVACIQAYYKHINEKETAPSLITIDENCKEVIAS